MTEAAHRRIEVAPRPHPLHLVSMAQADEFLCDGDFGLSVGEGHFPARVIQKITGSPYVHTIGIRRWAGGNWLLCESVPPRVRLRSLEECVAEYSGLFDFYRLAPGLCDLDAAWDWACKAEGTPYSYRDLWLVWRRRYRKAVAEGRCEAFDFPAAILSFGHPDLEEAMIASESKSESSRIPDPKPNSDDPDGCRRDCSSLWRAACRVNWIGPPEKLIAAEQEFDCDVAPGDFSVGPLLTYVATLI